MAKAKLEFDMTDEIDVVTFNKISTYMLNYDDTMTKLANAIMRFDQDFLRSKIKYEEISDDQYEAFQEAREQLWKHVKESGIDIEDLLC